MGMRWTEHSEEWKWVWVWEKVPKEVGFESDLETEGQISPFGESDCKWGPRKKGV